MRGIDAVLQVNDYGTYDLKIGFDGDIETEDSFDTYILVALLTDARATSSEILDASQRRGWIGNEYTPGFEMGSKLWLYYQSRLTRTVINSIQGEATRALGSLVDEGLAEAIRGTVVTPTTNGVTLEIQIERSPGETEKRYFDLWQNTGVR